MPQLDRMLLYLLDDLSHKERSVFFYVKILGLSQEETSRRLRLGFHFVNDCCKVFTQDFHTLKLKKEIFDAFDVKY
jgi:hypothetical protein